MIIVVAGLFKLFVQLITQIQLLRILIVQLGIFFIGILDFPSHLTDILHNLFRRYHVQNITESKIHIGNSLGAFRFQKRNEHIQQIIILIKRDFCNTIIRNVLRLYKRIFHLSTVCIAVRIYSRTKLFKIFLKAGYQ